MTYAQSLAELAIALNVDATESAVANALDAVGAPNPVLHEPARILSLKLRAKLDAEERIAVLAPRLIALL